MNWKLLYENKINKSMEFESRYLKKIPRFTYENYMLSYRDEKGKFNRVVINPFIYGKMGIIPYIIGGLFPDMPELKSYVEKYSYQFIFNGVFVDCSPLYSKIYNNPLVLDPDMVSYISNIIDNINFDRGY